MPFVTSQVGSPWIGSSASAIPLDVQSTVEQASTARFCASRSADKTGEWALSGGQRITRSSCDDLTIDACRTRRGGATGYYV